MRCCLPGRRSGVAQRTGVSVGAVYSTVGCVGVYTWCGVRMAFELPSDFSHECAPNILTRLCVLHRSPRLLDVRHEVDELGGFDTTPLQMAALRDDTAIVERLIAAAADVNRRGGGRDSPAILFAAQDVRSKMNARAPHLQGSPVLLCNVTSTAFCALFPSLHSDTSERYAAR